MKNRKSLIIYWVILAMLVLSSDSALAGRRRNLRDIGRRRDDTSGRSRRVKSKEVLLWQKADKAFMSGDYSQALEIYEKILTQYPGTGYYQQIVYYQGLSYLKQDDWERGRDCFIQLLKLGRKAKVDLDQAQLSLADSFFLQGDIEQAFLEYRKVTVDYPKTQYLATVYYQLGQCCRKQGRWEQTKYYFQKIRQDYPLSFEAKNLDQLLLNEALFFEIQVGSFKNKKNANQLCNKLLSSGYQTYVSPIRSGGRTFYRVRVGKFDSRTEAKIYEKKLKAEGVPTKICP